MNIVLKNSIQLLCLWLALWVAVPGAQAQQADSSLIATTDRYEFHSNLWVNLHHFLYAQAKKPEDAKLPRGRSLSRAQWQAMNDAITWYREHLADRDLLLDERMYNIKRALIRYGPDDVPDHAAVDAYVRRGGTSNSALPGGCGGLLTGGDDRDGVPYGCGRADIRIAEGADGELFILSKSDGMIREITGTAVPPQLTVSFKTPDALTLMWPAIVGKAYQIESKSELGETIWTDWSSESSADDSQMSATVPVDGGVRIFQLKLIP
jgi:hypothetical protein